MIAKNHISFFAIGGMVGITNMMLSNSVTEGMTIIMPTFLFSLGVVSYLELPRQIREEYVSFSLGLFAGSSLFVDMGEFVGQAVELSKKSLV